MIASCNFPAVAIGESGGIIRQANGLDNCGWDSQQIEVVEHVESVVTRDSRPFDVKPRMAADSGSNDVSVGDGNTAAVDVGV